MIFGERNAQKKKVKDLKGEVKQLKKQMMGAGCEKGTVNSLLGEFEETLILAEKRSSDYDISSYHISETRKAIVRLLDCMGESPVQEVKQSLSELVNDLDLVYHDCSIRHDDLDFKSTITCLKGMVSDYGNANFAGKDIMLRSELENIKAVLDDAAGFPAPNFFALAYYELHEDKDSLKEMENEQRNLFLKDYLKRHFTERFHSETKRSGVEEKVKELMENYLDNGNKCADI